MNKIRIMLKMFLLFLASLLICSSAFGDNEEEQKMPGQGHELISLIYTYVPRSDLKNWREMDDGDIFKDSKVTEHGVVADLGFPMVYSSGSTILLLGFVQSYSRSVWEDWPDDVDIRSSDLFATTLRFGLIQSITKKWQIAFISMPGYYSDYKVFSQKAINSNVWLGANYLKSADFQFGFGVTYMSQFGEPMAMPAFSFDWNMGKGFRMNVMAPSMASIGFYHSRVEISLASELTGGQYHLTDEATLKTVNLREDQNADGTYTADPVEYRKEIDYYLKYSTTTAGPKFALRLFSGFWIEGAAQFYFFRRYEVTDICFEHEESTICQDSDNFEFSNLKGNISYGFSGGIGYRF